MLICTYYLSSGSRFIIINHCFVWRCLASFHLPSFWQRRSKLPYSFQFVPNLFFVSIDCDNILLCIIKHRTALTNYCPVLTFYLRHTQSKRATFKYKQEGQFYLGVAKVKGQYGTIIGKCYPVFDYIEKQIITINAYKKKIRNKLERIRKLTSSLSEWG